MLGSETERHPQNGKCLFHATGAEPPFALASEERFNGQADSSEHPWRTSGVTGSSAARLQLIG
jgi:hypothetical protein